MRQKLTVEQEYHMAQSSTILLNNKASTSFANGINTGFEKMCCMKCAVYDTYVTKKDGGTMHFDVIVDASAPHEKAIEYGKEFLNTADDRLSSTNM